MSITKALIIKKIHLDKIFDEGKVWEMRTTKTKAKGKIWLIESGSGLIVGEVNLIGCSHIPIKPNDKYFDKHKVKDTELLKKWKYPWILSDAIRYETPIPYKHPQGAVIWVNFTPPSPSPSCRSCTELRLEGEFGGLTIWICFQFYL